MPNPCTPRSPTQFYVFNYFIFLLLWSKVRGLAVQVKTPPRITTTATSPCRAGTHRPPPQPVETQAPFVKPVRIVLVREGNETGLLRGRSFSFHSVPLVFQCKYIDSSVILNVIPFSTLVG